MLDAPQLRELEAIALEVAREAAALVLPGFRRGVRAEEAEEKAAADLVTDFDRESEALIRRRLSEHTPELALVGEESGGTAHGPSWYCDPIDGTTNFVHGLPWFCVSLGLLEGDQPRAGVIVAPALDLRYQGFVAASGERRALRNGEPCTVSRTARLDHALLATGFHPRAPAAEREANLAAMGRALPVARGVRRCGSAALDLALVADGTYDAYWERTLNSWDIAGGAALVLAAGGRLSDLSGEPPELSRGHILASNRVLHAAMLGLLDERGDSG